MSALQYVKRAMEESEWEYEDVGEFLSDMDVIWKDNQGEHRWYIDEFRVVKIGDRLIGFMWGITTGDMGILEIGWEFNEDSICFVNGIEKTVVVYEPVSG